MNYPERDYFNRIITLQRSKDYEGAYTLTMNGLALHPTDPFLLRTEIFLLFRLNRIKEARMKAEERFETLKNDSFFLQTYLMILEKVKARDDIASVVNNILSWGGRDEVFYEFLIKLADRVLGRSKALEMAHDVIIVSPKAEAISMLINQWEGQTSRPTSMRGYKEQFEKIPTDAAITELETIRILPDYANDQQLHLFLAELYKKKKDFARAVIIYQEILAKWDDSFTRKMLGYAYNKSGDIPNALVYLSEALIHDPFDHFLYRTVSRLYEINKDYAGFENTVNAALAKHPHARHLYGLLKKASKWNQQTI